MFHFSLCYLCVYKPDVLKHSPPSNIIVNPSHLTLTLFNNTTQNSQVILSQMSNF